MRVNARQARLLLFASWFLLISFSQQTLAQDAESRKTAVNDVLQVTVKSDGSYQLLFPVTGWSLAGRLPEGTADLQSTTGRDEIGAYQQLSVTYSNRARTAEIRIYDVLPIALLRDIWNSSGENENPFPSFQGLPAGLMRFSYQQRNFGVYEFGTLGPEGPWSLFDQQGHVLLLSPADHFQVSRMEEQSDGHAESRVLETIETLPAGFSHGTIITFGEGMNQTFATWGNALLSLSGKQRPANDGDVVLAKLGYWTDNGAVYYYKFEPQLGYEGTMLAVRDQFQKLGVPLGYMQLDSWWYPKGREARWDAKGADLPAGEYLYEADKALFPHGVSAFQQALGLPMVTHARWISPASPYRRQFKMSGNVVIDPIFWNSTAGYLHQAKVMTYEQDWLNQNAQTQANLDDPDAFLGNMAAAMRSQGITIQYCMPLPSHYMASTRYPNVETIRPSDDRFKRERWDSFLYDSRLASAVGLWPWTDVFFSDELPNLIISTLSAGPVGVGDALGKTNAQNLLGVVRHDGLIVKPDTPLLPIDAMYSSDAMKQQAPMVAMAQTNFGTSQARYVFAYPRQTADTGVSVPLAELGIAGAAYAYDWVTHSGEVISEGGTLRMQFRDGWAYVILSPVNRERLALLGETTKIVPLGKQRIASIEDRGAVKVTIKFAPDETTAKIAGYAEHRPKLRTASGKVKVEYDQQKHLFTAQVLRGRAETVDMQIEPR